MKSFPTSACAHLLANVSNLIASIRIALGLITLLALASCAPRTQVVDHTGLPLMQVKRGFCFVGCNINARLSDGTKCRGYSIGMQSDRPLKASLNCPERPTALLRITNVERKGNSVGTLTLNTRLFSQEPIDIDAIVKKHVP